MVAECQIQLGMESCCEVVNTIITVLETADIHRLFARCHFHAIVSTFCSTEDILDATSQHYAQAVFPKAIAYAKASDKVRGRQGMTTYLCRTILEIRHTCLIVLAKSFVRSLLSEISTIGR